MYENIVHVSPEVCRAASRGCWQTNVKRQNSPPDMHDIGDIVDSF